MWHSKIFFLGVCVLVCACKQRSPEGNLARQNSLDGYSGPPGMIGVIGGHFVPGEAAIDYDQNNWAFRLLGKLFRNGQPNLPQELKAVVVMPYVSEPYNDKDYWPERYIAWAAKTYGIPSVQVKSILVGEKEARDPQVAKELEDVQLIFFDGGDQSKYFSFWYETEVFAAIKQAAARGAAIFGTSAGAMILSEFCLCGGQLIKDHSLASGDHELLYFEKNPEEPAVKKWAGQWGVRTDFFGFIPRTMVDTHVTERGRIMRMVGTLADAIHGANRPVSEEKRQGLLAIGLDIETGLLVQDGIGEVVGDGEVYFLHETPETKVRVKAGEPLLYTHLHYDQLTEGWKYDLPARRPIVESPPPSTEVITVSEREPSASIQNDMAKVGANLEVRGSLAEDEKKFQWSVA